MGNGNWDQFDQHHDFTQTPNLVQSILMKRPYAMKHSTSPSELEPSYMQRQYKWVYNKWHYPVQGNFYSHLATSNYYQGSIKPVPPILPPGFSRPVISSTLPKLVPELNNSNIKMIEKRLNRYALYIVMSYSGN